MRNYLDKLEMFFFSKPVILKGFLSSPIVAEVLMAENFGLDVKGLSEYGGSDFIIM